MFRRNPSIDIMKGIAILCVILGHLSNVPVVMNHVIFTFHMPLFFFVAGFFFKPIINYKEKLKKDFTRLIIPFLVTLGGVELYLFILYCVLHPNYEIFCSSLWTFLFPSSMKGSIPVTSLPIWFLCALFWCRQVFNLIFTKLARIPAIAVCLTISVGFTLAYEFTPLELPFSIVQGLSAMIFYLAGWLASLIKKRIKWYHLIVALTVWILGSQYCMINMIVCHYNNLPLDILIAICGILSIYLFSENIEKLTNKPFFKYLPQYLTWVGMSSLAFFCAHTFEHYTFWGTSNIASPILLFAGKVLFCTIVTWLCYKVKITRQIFQLKK